MKKCVSRLWGVGLLHPARWTALILVLVASSPAMVAGQDPVGVCKDPRGCDPGSGSSTSGGSGSLSDGIIGKGVRGLVHIFKESDEARSRRLNEAWKANEAGIQFARNGDNANALTAYEKAARLSPDDANIKQNLANARERVASAKAQQAVAGANAETQQRNLRVAREAAERMHQSVEKLAQSVTAAPTTKGGLDFDRGNAPVSPSGGGGLDFTADITGGGKATSGAFGGKESAPSLGAPLGRGEVGANTKPGDQLGSIAKTDKGLGSLYPEAASQTARDGFDTGVKQRGSLSDVKVETPAGTMQMPLIAPAIANDEVIKASLDRYNKWLPELNAAKKEVEQAQATSDAAKDPGAKAAALTVLNAAKSKSDGLAVAVKSAIKEVSERMIHLEKLPVSKAPGADSKSPAAGSTPPGGGKRA